MIFGSIVAISIIAIKQIKGGGHKQNSDSHNCTVRCAAFIMSHLIVTPVLFLSWGGYLSFSSILSVSFVLSVTQKWQRDR